MSLAQNIKTIVLGNRPRLIFIAAIAVAVILVMSRPEQASTAIPEKAWRVDTIEVAPGSQQPSLELFGTILSPQDAELSAAIDAEVIDLKVLEGNTVAAGDVLMLLDGREAEYTLAEREAELLDLNAQLTLAQLRLERNRTAIAREEELLAITASKARRARELFADRLISESDVETTTENLKRQQLAVNQGELAIEETQLNIQQLKAQIARSRAQRDRARLDVERSVIVAPFSGVVSEIAASVGDRVRSGDALMRLQNPMALEIRAQVPSRYAESISDGLALDARIAARIGVEGRFLPGHVVRLSGQTREGSGGVDSFIRLDELPLGLRLGSTVRVLLDLPVVDNVIAVPAEAMYGVDRVYKVVDDRTRMVTVERVGERAGNDGSTEVLIRSSDLQPGDQLIVTKLPNAVDGLLVSISGLQSGAPDAGDETPAVVADRGDSD